MKSNQQKSISSTKQRKIYVVAAIHGNELFGLKVLARLTAMQNPNIILRIAHLEAIAKNVRYIESDLNRSFGADAKDSLETKLANRIKAEINKVNPDLIIDLHTSSVNVSRVGILAENNQLLVDITKHMGMEYAAVMPKNIAGQSLIGVCPEKSLCIELGRHLRSDALAKQLATQINTLANGDLSVLEQRIPLLFIERIIERSEAIDLHLENYVFNERLKGYPFLTGENNYDEHRGFLATSQIEV